MVTVEWDYIVALLFYTLYIAMFFLNFVVNYAINT